MNDENKAISNATWIWVFEQHLAAGFGFGSFKTSIKDMLLA